MQIELPVVSFLCVGLLILLSPIVLHSRNVAGMSLVAWLLYCNIIHGIDAIVWAGNDAISNSVWCDIVTRVLLAAQLALPGCTVALARNMRRCAMGQEVSTVMRDLAFCLIMPIFYVALHVIVQPHRFDIVQDFGCFASIYTSSVSLILIWIPPLVLCITTFVYAALAVRARLDSNLVFFSHMRDAPHLNIFAFMRPIVTSASIALVSLCTTAFSIHARIAAIGGLKTWSVDTWNGVHAHITEVFIVPPTSRIDLTRTEVEWWEISACSFILIVIIGASLVYRVKDHTSALPRWSQAGILRRPLPDTSKCPPKTFRGHMIFSTPSSPTLGGDDKSFCDVWYPSPPTKVELARLAIPKTPPSTHSSASTSSDCDREDPFVQSTLHYVGSPTGRKALGLTPLPPALFPPGQPQADLSPPSPPRLSPTPTDPALKSKPAPRPNSLLSAPWPRPPSAVPPSPRTPSPKYNAPITIQPPSPTPALASYTPMFVSDRASVLSIPTSFASSTFSMSTFYDDSEQHVMPFQDHIDVEESTGPVLAVPRHARRMRSRDMLLPRGLGASGWRRNGSDGLSGGTVVKEMA